jgi:hypothetical protein
MGEQQAYNIPLRYRKIENLHIVFWLLKDISWCIVWKPLGILMIFPTLIIAVVIAYRNKQVISELTHNVAIVFWISANSYWMISEFAGFDTKLIYATYTYKHLAVIPFVIGIVILAWFYLCWVPRDKKLNVQSLQ